MAAGQSWPGGLAAMVAPSRTALLVIDVQRDFCAPDGASAAWGADTGAFARPLANIHRLIAAARAGLVPIVFARAITRPGTDSFALRAFHAARGNPAETLAICRAGTQGAEYYEVRPEAGDTQIEKTLYSAFSGTRLDGVLRAAAVDTLVVAGFTTECCVDCTVRDAFHRDYLPVIVTDACAAYDIALHTAALAALSANCALTTETGAVVAAWC